MRSPNGKVVVVVEKSEEYSPSASFIETLRSLGFQTFVLSEERHPSILKNAREVVGNFAVNEIGAGSGDESIVSRVLRSTNSDLLVTIDGGYAISEDLRTELETSGVKFVSINFQPNADQRIVNERSGGASIMTLLPEDYERMSRGISIQHGDTSAIVPLAPRVARSWLVDLRQEVPQNRDRRVLVSQDGLDKSELARVGSIISAYSKAFSSGGEVGAKWCGGSFESVVKGSGSASYFWRVDSLNTADSLGDFRVELAAACGLTIVSVYPGERWDYLQPDQLEILSSRFDGLARIFPERQAQAASRFSNRQMGDGETNELSVEFELTLARMLFPLVGEPNSNGDALAPILISGWYGSGNLGDELILSVILRGLEKAGVGREIKVVTPLPAQVERIHGVPGIDIYDHAAVSREARHCSATVVGGGGLFQDYSFAAANGVGGMLNGPRQSIGAYAALPFFCEIWEKPWHAFGLGIGPLRSEGGRAAVRKVLRSAKSITVRDEESAVLVETMIGNDTPVVRAPDLVFALDTDHRNAESRLDLHEKYLILNLRPWSFSESFSPREVFRSCISFAELNNLIVVCLPFSPEDHAMMSLLLDEAETAGLDPDLSLLLPYTLNEKQILRELSGAHMVVAMRYHAHVLSFLAGTPCVGVAYDPKVTSLFQEVGDPDFCLDVDQIDVLGLSNAMTRAFDFGGSLPQGWMDRVLERKGESKLSLQNLANKLSGRAEAAES